MDPTLNINDLPSHTLAPTEAEISGEPALEPTAPTDPLPSTSAFDEANRDAETAQEERQAEDHRVDAVSAFAGIEKPTKEPTAPMGASHAPNTLTEAAVAASVEASADAAEGGFAAIDAFLADPDTDDNMLASLFGVNFEIDEDVLTRQAIDPNLVDTRDVFTSLFGAATETDVVIDETNREKLEGLMAVHRTESARDDLYEVFGDAVDGLEFERAAAFSVLHMQPPAPAPAEASSSRSWLVNMPTMFPNRQILHADPQPYFPSSCPYLESNARMLFTPENVMRWSYQQSKNLFLSNTRMVRWSDGSVTLHVGSDMHHIEDAKSNEALELLCKSSLVRKGEMEVPAFVASVFPARRCVVESNEANSIKQAVMQENMVSKALSSKMALPYSSAPLPAVDWNRPKKTNGPLEEYVATEYARRLKEIQARAKEGKRMSFAEQLEMESKLLEELRNTSVEELREMQEEAHRQETLRVAQRAQTQQNRSKRSRLERDLGLNADTEENRYLTVDGDDDDDEDGNALDQSSEVDFEDAYARIDAENQGNDDEAKMQQRRKMARLEQEQNAKAAPLVAAMQALAEIVPMTAITYSDVAGTLSYLQSGSFSPDMMKREIPSMLADLKQELPDVDVTRVEEALKNAF